MEVLKNEIRVMAAEKITRREEQVQQTREVSAKKLANKQNKKFDQFIVDI